MPRKRKAENKGFPQGWRIIGNSIWFNVPHGLESEWDGKKLFKLGNNATEAYAEWGKRVKAPEQIRTMNQVFDRYLNQVIPTKAAATQDTHIRAIKKLRPVFGHMLPATIRPRHAYQYIDNRGFLAVGKLEIAVLQHSLSEAVRWGVIDYNPIKGQLRIPSPKPRRRYVEDWELAEFLTLEARSGDCAMPMIRAYVKIKLLLGLRQGDILRLKESDITEEGILVTPHKTEKSSGKSVLFEWTDDLREAVAEARQVRPVDISPWLFCNFRGQCYWKEHNGRASGFESIWGRFMARAIKETRLETRFMEKDLRAKTASDAESDDRASELLVHSNKKTTQRVYRRKPNKIKPLR
jgi:integrase